jgi:arginine/ornithine transport system substrate-binding protein
MIREVLFTLALVAALPVQAADANKLRIGVEGNYPPFSQIGTDGKLSGFDIDLANALCAQIKAECTLVQQEWTGMIPALNAGKYDAIVASMDITEERKKSVDFSDKYYNVPSRFITKTGVSLTYTAAGLKGKRIGVLRNSQRDRALTEQFKDSEIVRYAKEADVYLDLAAGRVDTAFTSSIVGSESFLKKPEGKGFGFAGEPLYFGEGAGIAMRKSDGALKERINAALKAIRGNGTYEKIRAKYFDFDIYGK